MKQFIAIYIIITSFAICKIQAQEQTRIVKYSTAWFGPNANPVPEFTDAKIPEQTTLTVTADYYFGFGDRTKNGYLMFEVPLIPKKISLKIWSTFFEFYNVDNDIILKRNMLSGTNKGKANGDAYIQTRISILKDRKYAPDLLLNTTLKTASGTNFANRRYFDTPGYYFDLETAKSFLFNNNILNEIRLVGNTGFMCWETTGSRQNDALMYGLKLILINDYIKWENTIAGYDGWMHRQPAVYGANYGDSPLICTTKINFSIKKTNYFAQFMVGMKDFPYYQLRIGANIPIKFLTPHYK